MKYCLFIVEGPHDAAAIGKILTMFKLKIVQDISQLDKFWRRLIPNKFPFEGDLLKRMPVPLFYMNEELSIAIQSANSDSKIFSSLNGTLSNIDTTLLSGIGIFTDADNVTPNIKFNSLVNKLSKIDEQDISTIFNSIGIGEISTGPLKVGIYVFPNNRDIGTLENLLEQAARLMYPNLHSSAMNYIESVDDEYKRKWKNADQLKVLVGCISNILKPGKANQVSIQDNNWISDITIRESDISILFKFINKILS
ncbi:hypothetical protein B4102_3555 [Heyndrickxia sporothermodurans]|uniref:Uncharacterized protein n=1 Tax=Heyndrickxia sporothermodurans TaxID=46224 RepID=A0A150KLZ3_9BACI|nr:DUF3226 domain-containing protein [Heyndrickxia sporothermodurans]KYC96149.1 hypothetical protein B4102_3555 [Heyndrickxia sporothermodurans]